MNLFKPKFLRPVACSMLLLFSSCASLRSISVTPVPSDRGTPVESEVHDWAILGLSADNDFVDGLRDKLRSKCPNGRISGLLTKYENINYVLAVKRVVRASGYCEKVNRT